MNVYWLQPFWFGDVFTTGTNDTTYQQLTIDVEQRNIVATIGLTVLSPGLDLDNNISAVAAAGVKRYSFVGADGTPSTVTPTGWQSHLYVRRCTSVTFVFAVRRAWAKAEGMVSYYAD